MSIAEPGPQTIDLNFDAATIVFDIETGPLLDKEKLASFFEFDETTVKEHRLIGATFDLASVKYGSTIDPGKRAEKLHRVKEDFHTAQQGAGLAIKTAREKAWRHFLDRAALSALTGQVLAIGYRQRNGRVAIDPPEIADEANILERFWTLSLDCLCSGEQLVGFSIKGFDLPFMVRRSWALGVGVPEGVFSGPDHRYFGGQFVDLMERWQCGNRMQFESADRIALHLGVTRKTGNGADFARLWWGSSEERQQAVDYLKNDLLNHQELGEAMGII